MPSERSDWDMPIGGMDSVKEMPSEGALPQCLSGVCGGEFRWSLSCKIRNNAGSEFEWPTSICPERNEMLPRDLCEDEVCEDLPSERWDDVFLLDSLRSLLHSGQNVALINQRSTHFA